MIIRNENFLNFYRPAIIREGAEIYIEYYAWHPKQERLVRIKNRYNHLAKTMPKRELRKHLSRIAEKINLNLAQGINPFIEAELPKSYTSITEAMELFLKLKKES